MVLTVPVPAPYICRSRLLPRPDVRTTPGCSPGRAPSRAGPSSSEGVAPPPHRTPSVAVRRTRDRVVRTYSPKPGDIQRAWHVIDATDVVLGRLAVQTATLLRGKHKPIYAPHMDTGDFVIIINAEKVALAGDKKTTKLAYRHSGYPGGLTATPIGELLEKDARKVVEKAVWGMLPKNKLSRVQLRKL